MNLSLRPVSQVSGHIRVPGDKSVSHRAAIFGALAQGTTRITGFLRAHDTMGTLNALHELGAHVEDDGEVITIHGAGLDGLRPPNALIDCGNSGTTMRLLLGVLAGQNFAATLSGDASLSRRPMDRVRVPLSQMGARISGQGDKCAPPITIQGGDLRGITYEMPVASAQVKSAILLAGLHALGETIVVEPNPSRDHTERMLRGFGVEVSVENGRVSVSGGQKLHATDVSVPGDISSAAFFFVAAALRPNWQITVESVGVNPTRTGVLDVLQDMGARVELSNGRESGGEPVADVTVTGADLRATRIGGALIPRLVDELPVLALLATQAEGETVICDARELRVKESDRIATIARELSKLGANVQERDDGLVISGPTPLHGATVTSPRGDHRIAMTLAVAGLVAWGETTIENMDAVESSFPDFPLLLRSLAPDAFLLPQPARIAQTVRRNA